MPTTRRLVRLAPPEDYEDYSEDGEVIESNNSRAVISGDCIHHPIQIADVALGSSADTDADMAIQTRGALLDDLQGSETLLFGTHFATPSCGFVKQDKEGGGDYLLEVKHGDATADEQKL